MLKYKTSFLVLISFLFSQSAFATDSYRWLHVTIDTPWAIFIFLLPMVLLPIVLMAILYWRFAGKPANNTANAAMPSKDEQGGEHVIGKAE